MSSYYFAVFPYCRNNIPYQAGPGFKQKVQKLFETFIKNTELKQK